MPPRIPIEWRDYMILVSLFTTQDIHRWHFSYAEFRRVMINIGFTVVPLVSIVLRPTGRLATIHSGPFLFNESNAALNLLVNSDQQDRLAYVLRKQWGLSLRMFYLLGSEELDEISDD